MSSASSYPTITQPPEQAVVNLADAASAARERTGRHAASEATATSQGATSRSSTYPCEAPHIQERQPAIKLADDDGPYDVRHSWLPDSCPFETTHLYVLMQATKKLGFGGQGQVSRVTMPDGKTLVLKEDFDLVPPEVYTRHLTIAARLINCPYVVRYHAVVIKFHNDDHVPCGLLMEDLGDTSLRKWLKSKPKTDEEKNAAVVQLKYILCDVLRGLEALRDAGVIHFDIKPENIMVAPSGIAKLIDLGYAELATGAQARGGTKGFQSPDSLATSASDLWSFAATIEECFGLLDVAMDDSMTTLIFELKARHPANRPTIGNVLQRLHPNGVVECENNLLQRAATLLQTANEILKDRPAFAATPLQLNAEATADSIAAPLLDRAQALLRTEHALCWTYARDIAELLARLRSRIEPDLAFDNDLLQLDVCIQSGAASHLKRAEKDATDLRQRLDLSGTQTYRLLRRVCNIARLFGRLDECLRLAEAHATLDPHKVPEQVRLEWLRECAETFMLAGTRDGILKAVTFYDKVVQIERNSPDGQQRRADVMKSLRDKANAIRSLGGRQDLLDAIALYDEVLRFEQPSVNLTLHRLSIAQTLSSKATAMQELGGVVNLETAGQLLAECLRIQCDVLGDTHPAIATTKAQQATVYQMLGDRANFLRAIELYNEALRLLRLTWSEPHDEALRLLRLTWSEPHLSIAKMLCQKANAVHGLGGRADFDAALKLYDEALVIEKSVLGDSHSSVASTLCNKASTLQSYGDRKNIVRAIEMYDVALRVQRETLGSTHAALAKALGNKANALQELGDRGSLLQSIELFDEALEIERVAHGEDHPTFAATLCNKAGVLQSLGCRDNVAAAIELYDTAERIERAALGDEHTAVATTLSNKANTLLSVGDKKSVDNALDLYDEALRVIKHANGDKHPSVASIFCNKASALQSSGDESSLKQAIALYDQAFDIEHSTWAKSHSSVAKTLCNKASAILELGGRENLLQAIAFYDEAMRIEIECLGDEHPTVASTLSNKAAAVQCLGEREHLIEAIAIYAEVLGRTRASLGDMDAAVATALCNQANAIQELGEQSDLLQSIVLYDEALKIERAVYGERHPTYASTLANKANALQDLEGREHLQEALAIYDEALSIQRETLDPTHPDIAKTLCNKATALQDLRDRKYLEQALALYNDALEIERNAHRADHPEIADTLANKANVLARLGGRANLEEAIATYDVALGMARSSLGEAHSSCASIAANKRRAEKLLQLDGKLSIPDSQDLFALLHQMASLLGDAGTAMNMRRLERPHQLEVAPEAAVTPSQQAEEPETNSRDDSSTSPARQRDFLAMMHQLASLMSAMRLDDGEDETAPISSSLPPSRLE